MVWKTIVKLNLKRSKVVSICLAVMLLCTACLGLNNWSVNESTQFDGLDKDRVDGLKNSEVHDSIVINGNVDLESQFGSTGDGLSWETAYIVEDF